VTKFVPQAGPREEEIMFSEPLAKVALFCVINIVQAKVDAQQELILLQTSGIAEPCPLFLP